ncbi:hypothetical protein Hjap01_02359 [Haloarcula japonica]
MLLVARYGAGFAAQYKTLSNHDAKATGTWNHVAVPGACLLELTYFPDYR